MLLTPEELQRLNDRNNSGFVLSVSQINLLFDHIDQLQSDTEKIKELQKENDDLNNALGVLTAAYNYYVLRDQLVAR